MFFAVIVVMGFIFSTPNSNVAQKLMQNEVDKIKLANVELLNSIESITATNIAYAQGEAGEGTPICCSNNETPNEGEYCDPTNFQCTPMCCEGTENPNIGYRCDSNLCGGDGDGDQCPDGNCDDDLKAVCNDVKAINWENPFAPGNKPGGECHYLSVCCDPAASNSNAGEEICNGTGEYRHDQSVCSDGNPVCCNSGYDNYRHPSERAGATCDNNVCACNGNPHTGTQCGGGGDGNQCLIETGFSVIKSGVAIGGKASMNVLAECGSEDESTLQDYLAGIAAADATPDTPLNTPIILDALSSYRVTSKDYCLNIDDDQGSADGYNRSENGLCCEYPNTPDDASGTCLTGPSCGPSNGLSFDSGPTTGLCEYGNPSGVTTNTTSYSWSCESGVGENATEVQCSANRICDGGPCEVCTDLDCGQNDLCKDTVGSQDASYLSANNLASDGYGICWNATTGACGSISQVPYVTETPSNNLCISGTEPSSVSYDGDAKIYSWNCVSNTNYNTIDPTCQVRECIGTECQTDQSTGIIERFKAQPSIVSKTSEGCLLTWESNVDSTIVDPEQGCQLNGNSVPDDNVSGTRVGPGSYSLMCHLGVTFQIESLKCSIGPDYKEI